MQVYAPTNDCDEEVIDEFYEDLEKAISLIPKKDVMVIQGDWNAKIGVDCYADWKGTTGKFGLHQTNERGFRLLEFAKRKKLVVANTLHDHKISRRMTWHSPDGKTHNQIDYILVSKKYQTGINRTKTRTMKKPDIGSDHDLVMMTFRVKLKVKKKDVNTRIRFNLDLLKDPNVRDKYQSDLAGKFAPLLLLENPQEICDKFTNVIETTALSVLGKRRKTKRPWITSEIMQSCDERRMLKGKRFQNQKQLEKYREANRTVKKEIQKAKNEWIEKQAAEIEEGMKTNNAKKAFYVVKNLTRNNIQGKTKVIEDINGCTLTDTSAIAQRWKEYCTELYNHEATAKDPRVLDGFNNTPGNEDETIIILKSEVIDAISTLKTEKTPGGDNVTSEMIKEGGPAMVDILHHLCNSILKSGRWPTQWTESILIPIPKKSSSKKCSDYRTISLISHASKVLLKVIQKRIVPRIEEILSESQAGFRKDRSTVEQVTNLRLVAEKYRDHQKLIFHNFVDFRKAFDRVWHDALWDTMRKYDISEAMTTMIQQLYQSARTKVMVGNEYSNWFETTVGVRQGCILSPALFNLFLERIMQDALEDFCGGVNCGGTMINNLRFADDIDLLTESEEELKEITQRLENVCRKYGMEISFEKSKTLITGIHNDEKVNIRVDGSPLEQVKHFKYLGVIFTESVDCEREIKKRIGTATSTLARFDKIWKSRGIRLPTKIKLTKALVNSVLLYGCESWTLSPKLLRKIESFEMKVYRRLLGITWKERRTNDYVWKKVREVMGDSEPERLKHVVQKRKMKFFGHHVRAGRLTKVLLQGKVEGTRSRGRPRRSWTDDLEDWSGHSLATLCRKAIDRKKWRKDVSKWLHLRPNRLWIE